MPGRKGMKWGQHIFGDDDYDPHGRPAQIKSYRELEDAWGVTDGVAKRNLANPLEAGPKMTMAAPKDSKTGQRLTSHALQYKKTYKDKNGNLTSTSVGKPVKVDTKDPKSRDNVAKQMLDAPANKDKKYAVGSAAYGNKHYYQNALEMGNKIAGTYSHMSDADRSLMAKYGINMNPRRQYLHVDSSNKYHYGDFNQSGVAQARAYRDAVNAKNRNSRSDVGNALHDAGEALKARYKDIRGNVKRDMVNLRNKFNKTALGQLVKEYKKRKARAKNDLQRAARKITGK